jgi:hypothetical protein
MSLVLNKLVSEDIDEKIYLNHNAGIDIWKLEEMIKEELKDCIWAKIRAEVQAQFYTEQLEHIAKRIKQIKDKDNPYGNPNYKEELAKI